MYLPYDMRNAYNILVGKPEVKRPLRGPGLRREDITGMDPRQIGWEILDWMHLLQDRDHWHIIH
jgi:hypothetical protein